jgi:hypothetical protein
VHAAYLAHIYFLDVVNLLYPDLLLATCREREVDDF